MKILRDLFFYISQFIHWKLLILWFLCRFFILLTLLLSQDKLFKTIHVSKPDPLWACSWRLYSKIFLSCLYILLLLILNRNLKLFQHNYHHRKRLCSFFIYLFHHVLNHDCIYRLVYSIGENQIHKVLLYLFYVFQDCIQKN